MSRVQSNQPFWIRKITIWDPSLDHGNCGRHIGRSPSLTFWDCETLLKLGWGSWIFPGQGVLTNIHGFFWNFPWHIRHIPILTAKFIHNLVRKMWDFSAGDHQRVFFLPSDARRWLMAPECWRCWRVICTDFSAALALAPELSHQWRSILHVQDLHKIFHRKGCFLLLKMFYFG